MDEKMLSGQPKKVYPNDQYQQGSAVPTVDAVQHFTSLAHYPSASTPLPEEDQAEKEKLVVLSRAFDCHDEKELVERVEMYVSIVEQLKEQGVVTNKRDIIDWAVAYAFTEGEWYGDKLTTRLQNAMIVSALLLTVTATFFISPPDLGTLYLPYL